jgi:hypothetical protein
MSATRDRDEVASVLIASWVDTVKTRMKYMVKASSVDFIGGVDYKMWELDWIQQTLMPALTMRGFACSLLDHSIFKCDCDARPCDHTKNRVLRVQLTSDVL